MSAEQSMPTIYQQLGVTRVIHGAGTTTRYGGSLMRPETIDAMREASQMFVNIDDLNAAAGEAIAKMLGAEAALVTAGAASGLVLQSAACMTGGDPSKIAKLPNTEGMTNRCVFPAPNWSILVSGAERTSRSWNTPSRTKPRRCFISTRHLPIYRAC